MMKYLTLVCLTFVVVGVKAIIPDDSHVVHKLPCEEHDCTRDNFVYLSNSEGTLIGVCDEGVLKKSVNVVFYLQDGNGVQPFERQLVINTSSRMFSIITAMLMQYDHNIEKDGTLKGIKQDTCKNELAIINACQKYPELNLTCLPDKTTCAILNYSCMKPKDVLISIHTYNENTKKINITYINVNTNWKYYSFFAKLLCEYENFNTIPSYTITRQYRIHLKSNENNEPLTCSTVDQSDQVLQRIKDGIVGFCICLGITLIVLFIYLVYQRKQRNNFQQPTNNDNSANYIEFTDIPHIATTDDSSKGNTVVQQDLDVQIGQTSS